MKQHENRKNLKEYFLIFYYLKNNICNNLNVKKITIRWISTKQNKNSLNTYFIPNSLLIEKRIIDDDDFLILKLYPRNFLNMLRLVVNCVVRENEEISQ